MRFVLATLLVLIVGTLGVTLVGGFLLSNWQLVQSAGIWGVLAVLALPAVVAVCLWWDNWPRLRHWRYDRWYAKHSPNWPV